MRKTIFFMLLLISIGVSAKPYHHSLGISAGSYNGLSYKVMIKEHLAVQTDMGVHLTVYENPYGAFDINPMVMYQGTIRSFETCNIDYFIGGGTSVGMMTINLNRGLCGLEFGINALTGIECAFTKTPLALSIDFRPGYVLYNNGSDYTAHFFDWGIALGLRFYL